MMLTSLGITVKEAYFQCLFCHYHFAFLEHKGCNQRDLLVTTVYGTSTFSMCSNLYPSSLLMSLYVGHDKMVDMQSKGIACRIKKCADELLSIGSDLMNDAYSWELMGRDIRLKSMFLCCDLSQWISIMSQRIRRRP